MRLTGLTTGFLKKIKKFFLRSLRHRSSSAPAAGRRGGRRRSVLVRVFPYVVKPVHGLVNHTRAEGVERDVSEVDVQQR